MAFGRLPLEGGGWQVLRSSSPISWCFWKACNDFRVMCRRRLNNLATMIEAAQAQGIKVLLVAVPAKSLMLSDAPIYAELA